MASNKHMKIWRAVAETDPDHTKKVEFGRKFTAIDAHYQILKATETFGPVGLGWGYHTHYETLSLASGQTLIFCDLTFWYHTEEGMKVVDHDIRKAETYGPVRGCAVLQGLDSKGKERAPDTDAPKKAMTDALTKCLSHLGFSADVFLGQFDDNKYVEQRRSEKRKQEEAKETEYQKNRADFITQVSKATDAKSIDKIVKDNEEWISNLSPGIEQEIRSWAKRKAHELEHPPKDNDDKE